MPAGLSISLRGDLRLAERGLLPDLGQCHAAGRHVRWQLGWGLTDLQTVGLAMVGFAGVVAWSRGTIRGSLVGFRRTSAAHGGHLVVVLAMAGAAAAVLAGSVYVILLLLPSQNWVLGAADAYAHYVTLPVGLWVLAAVVTLAERSLPSAAVHRFAGHSRQQLAQPGLEDDRRDEAQLTSSPTS